MSHDEFEQLVADGIDALPEWVHKRMKNVAFLIDEEPTEEQLGKMAKDEHEELFGLYEGIPNTERSEDFLDLPDKITIFKNPILRTYSTLEEVKACVRNTIWHEVAHHFGHDEDWIDREEEKRGKTL